MLTATNKIVNHLTKIFYWIYNKGVFPLSLRLNSPFDGYSHSQAMPGRRRADLRPKFPYLLCQTFHAVLHADYSYRTTVRHLSVLPDLQLRTLN